MVVYYKFTNCGIFIYKYFTSEKNTYIAEI